MYVKEAIAYAIASFFRNFKVSLSGTVFFFIESFYLKFTIRKQKKYN